MLSQLNARVRQQPTYEGHMVRLLPRIAALGGLIACAGIGPPAAGAGGAVAMAAALAAQVDGCYVLRPGPWEQDAQLNKFLSVAAIPRRLRLTRQRAPGWEGMQSDTLPLHAVETAPGSPETRWIFTSWWAVRVGGDSIHIGTPLAFGGAALRVVAAPRGLVGELTTFTDAIPPDGVASATVPATLDRVPCAPREATSDPPAV